MRHGLLCEDSWGIVATYDHLTVSNGLLIAIVEGSIQKEHPEASRFIEHDPDLAGGGL